MKTVIYVVNSYTILSFEPNLDIDFDEQVLKIFGSDYLWFSDYDDALDYLFNGMLEEF